MIKQLILILGGARSGKSSYAQYIAAMSSKSVLYVATAQAGDDEMITRIEAHKKDRPNHWFTLETPVNVGKKISEFQNDVDVVILDCFTVLVSNLLYPLPEPINDDLANQVISHEMNELLAAFKSHPSTWIIISNEVGLGLVPPYPLGRVYRDVLGKANQRLGQEADIVIFMVAGLPMVLKGVLPQDNLLLSS